MPSAEKSLISLEEAEEVIEAQSSPLATVRTPLMIIVAAVIVAVVILLAMTLLSLRGARTGLSAILPFLDKTKTETLQVP